MRLTDRYEVIRPVGEGGGGDVLLVKDRLADNATMLLKRLSAHAQAGVARWLVNEFQILAQIDLPTVAPVFDFGLAEADHEHPAGPFFTRAFVDGLPLDKAFGTHQPASVTEVIQLMTSVLETLRALHRMGIVHGDLKPANLVLQGAHTTHEVVLIDFGLAHGALGALERIRGGTLAFMPPERRIILAQGGALEPDPRADLFAVAATMLALLGHDGVPSAPSPPRKHASTESLHALEALALRGCDSDPSKRFATADDFLASLERTVPRAHESPHAHESPRTFSHVRPALRAQGREAELGTLLEWISRRLLNTTQGPNDAPACVLVHGAEGTGRSTLLREIAWRAQLRGVNVVSVRADGADDPTIRLAHAARVLARTPDRSEQGHGDDQIVAWFAQATTRDPVLVLIDDLERGGAELAARLRSLAHAFNGEHNERFMLIAASSNETVGLALAADKHVTIGALDAVAVEALCRQVLGAMEPHVPAAVFERTRGVPAGVCELLDVLVRTDAVTADDVHRARLPDHVRSMVSERIDALDATVHEALYFVTLLGPLATETHLGQLMHDRAPNALRTCRSHGLVHQRSNGTMEIVSPVVLDATRARAHRSEQPRVLLASRCADLLARFEAPAGLHVVALIEALRTEEATMRASGAVAALRAQRLPHAAAQMLEALRHSCGGVLASSLALDEIEVLLEAGEPGRAAERARAWMEQPEESESERLRGQLLAGRALHRSGALPHARTVLTAGRAAAEREPQLARAFSIEIASLEVREGQYADAITHATETLALDVSPAERASLLAIEGLATSYRGDQARAVETLAQARVLYESLRMPSDEARVLAYSAIATERMGDLTGARPLLQLALDRAREAGDLGTMASSRLNLGGIEDQSGNLVCAMEHYAAAAKLARRAGRIDTALSARLNLAVTLVRLGGFERARSELNAVLDTTKSTSFREITAHATGVLGLVQARLGDLSSGLLLLDTAAGQFEAMGMQEGVVDLALDAASVLLGSNDPRGLAGATERLQRATAICTNTVSLHGRFELIEAQLMLARGEARRAITLLAQALSLAQTAQQWDLSALVYTVRAQAHRAMGAELHTRRDREHALEIYERLAQDLPPDLRSAFWATPPRSDVRQMAQSRDDTADLSVGNAVMTGSAVTVMAQDQRLVMLLEMSRRIAEEHDLQRVLQQAVRSAVELTNAERAAVLLVGDRGGLVVAASSDPSLDNPFPRSIAETAVLDGEVVTTQNARGDARFADYRSVHELSITAAIAAPMRTGGRIVGALYAENRARRGTWGAADVALMRALGEQAAVAVAHARLVAQLETRTAELELARAEIEALLGDRTAELERTKISLRNAEDSLKERALSGGFIGTSEIMRRLLTTAARVSESDVPVVIEGESGTGKEMLARAIHHRSARNKGPFVVVHCGSIPEPLLESELFGHIKGSFTGADRDRKGLIASAHGGTLVLDEVTDMPARMQVELLRVLQDRTYHPMGSEHEETADIRVITTTQRPLGELVKRGIFREDLFYRLTVVALKVPPLREHLEDLPALVVHILKDIAQEHGIPLRRLAPAAFTRLQTARWNGNIRQLRHVLASAAVLSETEVIQPEQLTLDDNTVEVAFVSTPSTEPPGPTLTTHDERRARERVRIIEALENAKGNRARAAIALGMARRTFYRRLEEFGLLAE